MYPNQLETRLEPYGNQPHDQTQDSHSHLVSQNRIKMFESALYRMEVNSRKHEVFWSELLLAGSGSNRILMIIL